MKPILASEWASRLTQPDEALRRSVVNTFLERFGDRPLRLFRSPGRINLRGMHVDTHGGCLNLMTHQREVVVAATAESDGTFHFANIDPQFPENNFAIAETVSTPSFSRDWLDFIMDSGVRRRVDARRGHWANYIEGAVLSVQHRFPGAPLRGLSGVVGSDLPRGAALSSSAALCVALALAVSSYHGQPLERDALIVAARDAEWYTGSRCGLSDQAAMVLPGRDELVSVTLNASALDTSSARRMAFPEALKILVINSYTERSLSGAALVDYTRNRFAYSLAMAIVQQELRAQGVRPELAASLNKLARLSPVALREIGGARALFDLLRRIPESIGIAELRSRYELPQLDQAYEQYFGTVPEKLRPDTIGLRGPLLFGIAESERARVFPATLQAGDYATAGILMTTGHDGDRRVNADGSEYRYDLSDAALDALAARDVPIEFCPGCYGASSPVLDALVDAALEAGALGASLTGAGIAGTVLALCRAEDVDRIAAAVRRRLLAPDYTALARRTAPLTEIEIEQAVLVNAAPAPAGELTLP